MGATTLTVASRAVRPVQYEAVKSELSTSRLEFRTGMVNGTLVPLGLGEEVLSAQRNYGLATRSLPNCLSMLDSGWRASLTWVVWFCRCSSGVERGSHNP